MARWRKTLARMRRDSRPTGYSYTDAAQILVALGFELAPAGGGSHRKWRLHLSGGDVVIVGLVEKGNGNLKPYLVRDLIAQLSAYGLIPEDLE